MPSFSYNEMLEGILLLQAGALLQIDWYYHTLWVCFHDAATIWMGRLDLLRF